MELIIPHILTKHSAKARAAAPEDPAGTSQRVKREVCWASSRLTCFFQAHRPLTLSIRRAPAPPASDSFLEAWFPAHREGALSLGCLALIRRCYGRILSIGLAHIA